MATPEGYIFIGNVRGLQGKSAYQLDVEVNGYEGSIDRWLAELHAHDDTKFDKTGGTISGEVLLESGEDDRGYKVRILGGRGMLILSMLSADNQAYPLTITGIAAPEQDDAAVNKKYVDTLISALEHQADNILRDIQEFDMRITALEEQ